MIRILLLLLVLRPSLLLGLAHDTNNNEEEELYQQFLDQAHLEEEQSRHLIAGIDSDGSVGSKCGLLAPCQNGYECFKRRCIPSRDCLKLQLQDFNAHFDSEAYKRRMYQSTNMTENDIALALQQSNGDKAAFAQSHQMQSMMGYMQANRQPFEEVEDIVHRCAGLGSTRRRLNNEQQERGLQDTPGGSTTFLGVHVEAGVFFEGSVTVAWKDGASNTDTFLRYCFGAEIGGGLEVSFYIAITFDGLPNGWGCASSLFDADAGLGLYLGLGYGLCFLRTTSSYVEITIGAGLGAGIGWNICGMCVLPAGGDGSCQ